MAEASDSARTSAAHPVSEVEPPRTSADMAEVRREAWNHLAEPRPELNNHSRVDRLASGRVPDRSGSVCLDRLTGGDRWIPAGFRLPRNAEAG